MDRHRTGDGVAIGDNSPSEALGFARKVMKRIDRVREHSVREVSGRELVSWAVEGLYQAQGGKAPLAVRERLSAVRDIPNEELVELLRDARAGLGRPPDLADDQDLDRAIGHMLFRLDPHGGLVRLPHRIGCFRDTAGIGVRLAGDASKKWPRVVTPIKDGPAYQAGIKAGDVITHITLLDRDEVFLTENLPLDRVEQLLTGRAEVKVRLTVRREGEKRPRELEMARCWVEEETVLGSRRKADDSWDYWLDREERVGYVRLTRFGRDTAGQLTQVVGELTRQGLKGLILDLRSNPGGLLKSATEVADLFINDGDIVTIQPRTGLPYGFRGSSSDLSRREVARIRC